MLPGLDMSGTIFFKMNNGPPGRTDAAHDQGRLRYLAEHYVLSRLPRSGDLSSAARRLVAARESRAWDSRHRCKAIPFPSCLPPVIEQNHSAAPAAQCEISPKKRYIRPESAAPCSASRADFPNRANRTHCRFRRASSWDQPRTTT